MHCLLVAATAGEIAPFTDHLSQTSKLDHIELDVDILVTGVGVMATTYALTRYLQYKRPDLVIQAGVGGLFDRSLPLGTVFAVKQDVMADLGVAEKGSFQTITDLGWMHPNEAPFKRSVLVNPASTLLRRVRLPKINAITVNEISTKKDRIAYYQERYKAGIESMEGAALHYVCRQENIGFLQLRAASNYIGDRNKKNWRLATAIGHLNAKLIQLLENL